MRRSRRGSVPQWVGLAEPINVDHVVIFKGLTEQAQLELLVGLWQCTAAGVRTLLAALRPVVAALRQSEADSLEDLDGALIKRTRHDAALLARMLTTTVRRLPGLTRDRTRQDVWDLTVFGLTGNLGFSGISQPRLREIGKRWVEDDRGASSSCAGSCAKRGCGVVGTGQTRGAARINTMSVPTSPAAGLLRRGRRLEGATLAWNVIGIIVLGVAAWRARSVALAGFGLDSLIEIGASTVVLWELSGTGQARQHRALRLIGAAFLGLAGYLTVQSIIVLATGYHPRHSPLGIAWTAITALVMFALAAGKKRVGEQLANPVLITESRVTVIDGLLATAVLLGLLLNAVANWWWADPATGFVIVYYAVKEARSIFGPDRG